MKTITRRIAGIAVALLAAVALSLAVAMPASAVSSTVQRQNCTGTPYTPRLTMTGTGSWYIAERKYPAVAGYTNYVFYGGQTVTRFGSWTYTEWGAAESSSGSGNISSWSKTCA